MSDWFQPQEIFHNTWMATLLSLLLSILIYFLIRLFLRYAILPLLLKKDEIQIVHTELRTPLLLLLPAIGLRVLSSGSNDPFLSHIFFTQTISLWLIASLGSVAIAMVSAVQEIFFLRIDIKPYNSMVAGVGNIEKMLIGNYAKGCI